MYREVAKELKAEFLGERKLVLMMCSGHTKPEEAQKGKDDAVDLGPPS